MNYSEIYEKILAQRNKIICFGSPGFTSKLLTYLGSSLVMRLTSLAAIVSGSRAGQLRNLTNRDDIKALDERKVT